MWPCAGRARARKLEPQGCHDDLSPNEGSGDGMARKGGWEGDGIKTQRERKEPKKTLE